MKGLRTGVKVIDWVIALAALAGIIFIAYFNVQAWIAVLQGKLGFPFQLAAFSGAAIFCLIQGMEVRPLFLKALHTRSDQLLAIAQGQSDAEAKALIQELKEETDIRPNKLRRAKKMAYLFTLIDLACCVLLLFTPIIRPGVSIMTVILTMGLGLIVWENVLKTLATVWLFPWLCMLILSETRDVTITKLKKMFESAKAGASERMNGGNSKGSPSGGGGGSMGKPSGGGSDRGASSPSPATPRPSGGGMKPPGGALPSMPKPGGGMKPSMPEGISGMSGGMPERPMGVGRDAGKDIQDIFGGRIPSRPSGT